MLEDNHQPIVPIEEETPTAPETTPAPGEEKEEEKAPETPAYVFPSDETVPEKFRGKKPEDVLKSYTELESMIGRKAQEIANTRLKELGLSTEEKKEVKKEVAEEIDLSKIDFSKMKPEDFAKWVLTEVDKRSEMKARHIMKQDQSMQTQVGNEIREAQAKHPQLKDVEPYREAVLAFIENASARGETLSLEDACQKVDSLMGIKPAEKAPEKPVETPVEEKKPEVPAKPKPHVRAGVETTTPTPGGDNLTDEERVVSGILNAGGGSKNTMGGLGI